MDPQKDIKKYEEIRSKLKLEKLGIFNNDPYSVFIYKKTHSILTALYLVTNYFPDAEPAKWQLREKGNNLINAILSLPRKDVSLLVLGIISLSEVSAASSLISDMNFRILRNELENLILLLENGQTTLLRDGNFILDEKLFQIPEPQVNKGLPSSVLFKGQSARPLPKGQENKGQEKPKGRDDRRNSILALLKKDAELSIKDISQVLTDCSEKTIQRGLSKLVDEGLARKVGEKRWSKYSLN